MSERKVLNKYYPPDFDPSKIPRMKLPKNRQYTVRLMAPFNMRCATCGEYIYKGKKFNARKEDVENEDYLGIRIYRFYIKCTRCLQEISFKTDPKNTDYEIEAGATRNFMALKLAEEQALREEEEQKEEEASNPMKLLENRTKQSKNEIELLESLEELKDLNRRQQAVDYDSMLSAYDTKMSEREREEKMQQLDEAFIKTVKFQSMNKRKLIVEEEIIEDEAPMQVMKPEVTDKSNKLETSEKDMKLEATEKVNNQPVEFRIKNVRPLSKYKPLCGLVKVNKAANSKQHAPKNCMPVNAKPTIEASTHIAIDNVIVTKKAEIESKNECVTQCKSQSKSNGLSMLGAYSGSENSDSN